MTPSQRQVGRPQAITSVMRIRGPGNTKGPGPHGPGPRQEARWRIYGVWQAPLRQRLRPQQSSSMLQFWASCLQQKFPEPRFGTWAHNCVALQHCCRRRLSSQVWPSLRHRSRRRFLRPLFLRFLLRRFLRAASASSSLRPTAPRSPSMVAAAPPAARPKRRLVHVSNWVSSNSAPSGCGHAGSASAPEYVKFSASDRSVSSR